MKIPQFVFQLLFLNDLAEPSLLDFFSIFDNQSDSNVLISWDGVSAHDFFAAGEHRPLNLQANNSPSGEVSKVKKWTKFYVQGVTGKGGNIYLSGYYN